MTLTGRLTVSVFNTETTPAQGPLTLRLQRSLLGWHTANKVAASATFKQLLLSFSKMDPNDPVKQS